MKAFSTTTLVVITLALFAQLSSAFMSSPICRPASSNTLLMGLRRNNKDEKRKRNRDYARQFRMVGGVSRKKIVIEMKRQIVAKSEEEFTARLFQLTSDEDMPEYSGFDD